MKVSYTLLSGATSTAYLDTDPEQHEGPMVISGVDKHTDEPVTVALTDGGWVEVPSA